MPKVEARVATFVLALSAGGCRGSGEGKGDVPPPPPPPAASARADVCAGGGGKDTDAISAAFVPRAAGGYCLDPQGEPKTYGDQGKLTMDEVCTTAFDGECEVYKRFGLDRVVALRYVDGTGAPNSVDANVSRFKTIDGAYAMFTKRVVADGDPARASVRKAPFGAAGATSSSNAYVWRGRYLAELTFVTEDTTITPAQMAKANRESTDVIAKEIGDELPGALDLPPAAAELPTAFQVPLGVEYRLEGALGVPSIGPAAIGYYKDGDRRWRQVALALPAAAAKAAFRAIAAKPGSLPLAGFGDEAAQVVVQEAPDRARATYVVARKGARVVAVGDEELVLDPAAPAAKQANLKLTQEEKLAKLGTWLKL